MGKKKEEEPTAVSTPSAHAMIYRIHRDCNWIPMTMMIQKTPTALFQGWNHHHRNVGRDRSRGHSCKDRECGESENGVAATWTDMVDHGIAPHVGRSFDLCFLATMNGLFCQGWDSEKQTAVRVPLIGKRVLLSKSDETVDRHHANSCLHCIL